MLGYKKIIVFFFLSIVPIARGIEITIKLKNLTKTGVEKYQKFLLYIQFNYTM